MKAALLFLLLGACTGESPVQVSNGAEQSPRHRRGLSPWSSRNDPYECFNEYGSSSSSKDYFFGFSGQDIGDFGGAIGTLPVCLIEVESNPVTNSMSTRPMRPSLGNGIIGLSPSCSFSGDTPTRCNNNETDVISSLVKSGSISSFQFTMCFEENGGNLYLGPGQYPESTKWFPANPFIASGGEGPFWSLKGPSDGSSVGILARGSDGHETSIGEITSTEYNEGWVCVDSGTYGFIFPQKFNSMILRKIANVWADDEEATQIFACYSVDCMLKVLEKLQQSLELRKEEADHLNSLVPDLVFRGFDGGDIVVDGSLLLYETYPSSGIYLQSWQPGNELCFGTGFLLYKTVVFDNSEPSTPRIGIVSEEGGDCNEHDYSEKGNIVKMSAPGGLSNLLQSGTYLGEIEFGGQTQLVQLDTGSQMFMLPNKPSCMQMDAWPDSCLNIFWVGDGIVYAYVNKDDGKCSKYAPLIASSNYDSQLTLDGFVGYYVGPPVDFLRTLMEVQPFAECQPLRAYCGKKKGYRKDLSPSFHYFPIGSNLTLGEWKKPPDQLSPSVVSAFASDIGIEVTCSMTGAPSDEDGGESDHEEEGGKKSKKNKGKGTTSNKRSKGSKKKSPS